MVIDVFSKYGWITPLKSKTGIEVANAFKQIFKHGKPDKKHLLYFWTFLQPDVLPGLAIFLNVFT